jgi:hypothetical protein
MKQTIKKIFRNTYRLMLSDKGQQNCIWSDVKKFYKKNNWKYSIIEQPDVHVVQVVFQVEDKVFIEFETILNDNDLTVRTLLPWNYDEDMASDVFIMATHLNNLFRYTKINVLPESREVGIQVTAFQAMALVNTSTAQHLLNMVYETAEDVNWAYHRLLETREAPALIFAEFLEHLNAKEEK